MRLIFFDDYHLGVLRNGLVHNVTGALGAYPTEPEARAISVIETINVLRPTLERAASEVAGIPLDGLRVRAPIPRPPKIICAAVNYREHGFHQSLPIDMFLKSPEALLDPGGTVELPPAPAKVFQHEAELAAVIGRRGHAIPAAEALGYVAAYTAFCDVSARGLTPGGFFSGKSFDTFAPIGPVLVTPDEVPNPQNLNVELDVNGQPRQRFNTSDMANPVADLIAFASSVCTLLPGDIIATGTNHQALGALQQGDQVEIRIADWPALRFQVHDPLDRHWSRELDPEMAARAKQPRG